MTYGDDRKEEENQKWYSACYTDRDLRLLLGDIQKPSGHGPGKLALGGPA